MHPLRGRDRLHKARDAARWSLGRPLHPGRRLFYGGEASVRRALIARGLTVLVMIVLIVLAVFLGTIGRIGLIRGTYQAEQGAESLVFGELFSGSMPYFWRVFGLSFLVGLAFLLVMLPLITFGVLTAGIGFACLLPLFCLLVPLPGRAEVHIVTLGNNFFQPNDLTIKAGDTVRWVNSTGFHDVAADNFSWSSPQSNSFTTSPVSRSKT